MSSTSTLSQTSTEDDEQQRLVVERVLKHLRLAKARRTLQVRLGLANFKASRGWQNMPLEEIEPYFLSSPTPHLQVTPDPSSVSPNNHARHPVRHASLLHPYRRVASTTSKTRPPVTPDRRPQADSRRTFSQVTPSTRSPYLTLSPPSPRSAKTPEPKSLENDPVYTDQTVAAELMLFLAAGSPSPSQNLRRGHHQYSTSAQR